MSYWGHSEVIWGHRRFGPSTKTCRLIFEICDYPKTIKKFQKIWWALNKVLVDSSEDKKVSLWQVKKVYFWNKKEVSRFRLFFNWPPDIQFTPFMHKISTFRFFKWSLILAPKIISSSGTLNQGSLNCPPSEVELV